VIEMDAEFVNRAVELATEKAETEDVIIDKGGYAKVRDAGDTGYWVRAWVWIDKEDLE